MSKKEELLRKFVEADCQKFAGLLNVYTRLIEAKIPYAPNSDHAQGMAEAVAILQDGIDKAQEVAKLVSEKKYNELERRMREENLPMIAKALVN